VIKYFIILLSFIILIASCASDGIRKNRFYDERGRYTGYSVCDQFGCQFFDKKGHYQGYERFTK